MGLSIRHPEQFFLGIIEWDVGICVQRYGNVTVSHDILQSLWTHSRLCHIGAEGMPAHMGCDLRQLYPVDLMILPFHGCTPSW